MFNENLVMTFTCIFQLADFKQAEAKNKKMQELNRFVHYYTRFKNHENSYKVSDL